MNNNANIKDAKDTEIADAELERAEWMSNAISYVLIYIKRKHGKNSAEWIKEHDVNIIEAGETLADYMQEHGLENTFEDYESVDEETLEDMI